LQKKKKRFLLKYSRKPKNIFFCEIFFFFFAVP